MLRLKKCLSFFIYNLVGQISAYNFFLTKSLSFDFDYYKVFTSSSEFVSCFETLFHFHRPSSIFFGSSYGPFLDRIKLSKESLFAQIAPIIKEHSSALWRLHGCLDYFLAGLQTSPHFACQRLLNFWHLRTPLSIISYLNQEVPEWSALNTLIYKAMKQLNTSQLNFFLDKFLQYIKTFSRHLVLFSILELTSSSPLFAHQVLWQIDVVLNQGDLQQPPDQPYPSLLSLSPNRFLRSSLDSPDLTVGQIQADYHMLKSLTFSRFNSQERNSFLEIDVFQKTLTRICNVMQPKFSKDRKKELIKEELNKVTLPAFFYLPTHPNYRITSFDPQKAIPMNSAAKCPYLIFFQALPFEESDLFSSQQTRQPDFAQRFRKNSHALGIQDSVAPETAQDKHQEVEFIKNLLNVSTRSRLTREAGHHLPKDLQSVGHPQQVHSLHSEVK